MLPLARTKVLTGLGPGNGRRFSAHTLFHWHPPDFFTFVHGDLRCDFVSRLNSTCGNSGDSQTTRSIFQRCKEMGGAGDCGAQEKNRNRIDRVQEVKPRRVCRAIFDRVASATGDGCSREQERTPWRRFVAVSAVWPLRSLFVDLVPFIHLTRPGGAEISGHLRSMRWAKTTRSRESCTKVASCCRPSASVPEAEDAMRNAHVVFQEEAKKFSCMMHRVFGAKNEWPTCSQRRPCCHASGCSVR